MAGDGYRATPESGRPYPKGLEDAQVDQEGRDGGSSRGDPVKEPPEVVGSVQEESADLPLVVGERGHAESLRATAAQEYDYVFSVWPHEHGWEVSVYEVFDCFPRVCLTMTEDGFRSFRNTMERSGLTLREVERVPHFDPEPVLG